ncbi:MAG: hypothetical protein M1338_01350 [Patescibacteria group bacterium]|nr:hypothetical protein [Patescibacteria group bacterium]
MPNKSKNSIPDSKHMKSRDQELVETNAYLRLDREHKKWYRRGAMGKQRGKPKYAPPKEKK